MIKQTLYFSNPAHLYMRNGQLCISHNRKSETEDETQIITRPVEDIGVVVMDHQQITITSSVIEWLLENNVAFITCDATHHPTGLMLPLSVNSVQTERFRIQLEASEPLKKQVWQQTVTAKLRNQGRLLELLSLNPSTREREMPLASASKSLLNFARDVKSGDGDNHEARGAAMYWQNIFDPQLNFRRQPGLRGEAPPNNLLDYGYAVLRAIVARALVASGLLPTFGVHHRNKYNAYCLADDIMEPYRPYVDQLVLKIVGSGLDYAELSKEIKEQLLKIPALEIMIDGEKSPLMVGLQRTTGSLMKCFEGETKKVIYPEL